MPKLKIAEIAEDADQAIILNGLISFNDAAAGPSNYDKVAVLLCADDTEATVGGIWGKISYDWLFVELLFVLEEHRRNGFGDKLMRAAEQRARDSGCVGVWLDTHGFQAPGFYQDLGYKVFGQLENHPRGFNRFFLCKRL